MPSHLGLNVREILLDNVLCSEKKTSGHRSFTDLRALGDISKLSLTYLRESGALEQSPHE